MCCGKTVCAAAAPTPSVSQNAAIAIALLRVMDIAIHLFFPRLALNMIRLSGIGPGEKPKKERRKENVYEYQ